MNADKMTREEFEEFLHEYATAPDTNKRVEFWNRFDAIQKRPFQPDWDEAHDIDGASVVGFTGEWLMSNLDSTGHHVRVQAFYIAAPNNPTDAELVAMFEAFDLETKKRAIEAVKG